MTRYKLISSNIHTSMPNKPNNFMGFIASCDLYMKEDTTQSRLKRQKIRKDLDLKLIKAYENN